MKRKREYLKYIFLFALPIIFQFLGQASITNDFCSYIGIPEINMRYIKDIFFCIGIVFTFIPLGIDYVSNIYAKRNLVKQQEFLIKQIKTYFIKALEGIAKQKSININIRIFLPKKIKGGILGKGLHNLFGLHKKFVMKNVKGFESDDFIEGLEFEVDPDWQGLVGLCYKNQKITYDIDLSDFSLNLNMNKYQRNETKDIVFCTCIPLFSKKDKIFAIMQVDSKNSILLSVANKDEFFVTIDKFCRDFSKSMECLFK